MLISFAIENYKSFLEENILSMEAKSIDEFNDLNTFSNDKYILLKSAFIFGANSSGKSNFLDAFYNMRISVLRSFTIDDFFSKSCDKVFKFNTMGTQKPTTFKAEFLIGDVRYYYEFSIKDGLVVKEYLSKDFLKEVRVFERNSSDALKTYVSTPFRKMSKNFSYVRPNALIISTLAHLNDPLSQKISNWFKGIEFINSDNLINNDSIYEDRINNYIDLIKLADNNIKKLRVDLVDIDSKVFERFQALQSLTDIEIPSKIPDLFYSVSKFDESHNYIEDIEVDFDEMSSSGTKNFMNLIIPIMDAIEGGKVIVIDELESMLHVSLVKFIFNLFNSIDVNKNNAQLITTTHDVFILNEDIRRDQINFVEKNKFAESSIYALTDFKNVIKSDNILKKYLLGFYGAVPQIQVLFNAKNR